MATERRQSVWRALRGRRGRGRPCSSSRSPARTTTRPTMRRTIRSRMWRRLATVGSWSSACPNDTTNWNPATAAWTPSEFEVGRAIYDRLAVYSDSHELLPDLAKSIDHNSDFTEWTITLRSNIVFHDGTPLDAAALKTNLEAQQLSPVAGPLLVPGEVDLRDRAAHRAHQHADPVVDVPALADLAGGLRCIAGDADDSRRRGAPHRHGPVRVRLGDAGTVDRGGQELLLLARRTAPTRCRFVPRDPRRRGANGCSRQGPGRHGPRR